jgi:UTP--glucose-1-phosphate uridylyltransferase
MATLATQEAGAGGEIQLTDSMAKMIGKQPFHGVTFKGERFDCGSKLGFAQANFALACRDAAMGEDLKSWARGLLAD